MKDREIMAPVKNIRGGAKPRHNKNTAECKTVVMPAPSVITVAMQQHIGAPCTPCVAVGDTVYVGTKIADSDKFVSAPIHSGVSGKISAITTTTLTNGVKCEAIKIENDGLNTPDPDLAAPVVETEEQLVKAVRDMGLVGLGGAGFPTHVKLIKQPDKPLDTLIINGAECEPYITADYRECIENPNDVLEGVYKLLDIMKFERVVIAIEDNKPEAIKKLYDIAADKRDTENRVKLMKLKSRYPQGAEKVLIYTTTGRKLPLGKLPADIGCVVMNITSIAAIGRYLRTGMPLTTKRLTIDGDAIMNPQNVTVTIGTTLQEVVDFCGGFKEKAAKIVVGGPMMGFSVCDTDIPVLKQNNAILCFGEKQAKLPKVENCIRCGKCAEACPMGLAPFHIAAALKREDLEAAEKLGANYCMECGSCAFNCPSARPIVQVMRATKQALRNK